MGVKTAGFTIIETLMFLAISGLMMVTMIVGVSATLANQRYNDSVRSLQSLIQEQYSKISSIENNRPADRPCGLDSTALPQQNPVTPQTVGQSKCEMVGRYMIIDRGSVAIYPVLAYRDISRRPSTGSDISYMQNASYMRLGVDKSLADTSQLEWGTEIAWPRSGNDSRSPVTPRTIGVLFIRSPDSGQVYTFTSNNANLNPDTINEATIRSLIRPGDTIPGQAGRALCVDPMGITTFGSTSVYINSFASGSNAIETRTNDAFKSLGMNTEC